MRRFADLRFGRIAYVERGSGQAALFSTALRSTVSMAGCYRAALNRTALYCARFHGTRVFRDSGAPIAAANAQVAMLAAFLDALAIGKVDIVASDSGGAVAHAVRGPSSQARALAAADELRRRGRQSAAAARPVIEMARAGTLAEATAKWLTDKALARSTFGAAVYRDPSRFADETIEYYVTPLVSTPLRRALYHSFDIALEPNPLAGIEASLKRCMVPVRIVWGASDDIFAQEDAEYLDRTLPRSLGIRRRAGSEAVLPGRVPGSDCRRSAPTVERVIIAAVSA